MNAGISLFDQFTVLGAVVVTLSVIATGVYKAWKEFTAWSAEERKAEHEERQAQRDWQEEQNVGWQHAIEQQNLSWQKYIEEQRINGEKLVAQSLLTMSKDLVAIAGDIGDNTETLKSNSRLLLNLQSQLIEHHQMTSAKYAATPKE